ncbi:2'-5' RNA ligase family protein [Halorubrum sp. F4]|uniref:2'-5' RNA ligase family protein n=1 Tax=Halorubrum sp. F4 TaxID=2989715 RepID=UPI002480A3D6|nr:2'-5' RNA ligase family protein [Halorubrum sp. F4]
MFSLNVPLPPPVERLAGDLQPKLSGYDRVRDRHTLVCKRFGVSAVTAADDPPPRPAALDRIRDRLRPLLAPVDPFAVAVTGVGAFETPASGSDPVVYLAVESDALLRLHRRLCVEYGAIEGIEGEAYVPHVTLARGGSPAAASRLVDAGVEFDPIRWRVHALDLYDPKFREVAATIEL